MTSEQKPTTAKEILARAKASCFGLNNNKSASRGELAQSVSPKSWPRRGPYVRNRARMWPMLSRRPEALRRFA